MWLPTGKNLDDRTDMAPPVGIRNCKWTRVNTFIGLILTATLKQGWGWIVFATVITTRNWKQCFNSIYYLHTTLHSEVHQYKSFIRPSCWTLYWGAADCKWLKFCTFSSMPGTGEGLSLKSMGGLHFNIPSAQIFALMVLVAAVAGAQNNRKSIKQGLKS